MTGLEIAVAAYVSYLIGSLSSAIIVCKIMRLPDPRTHGSHNPGTTNVLRIGGKKAAIITLVGDVLKGVIPVLIAKYLGFETAALALIAFTAFLGHLFPIFFKLEGGKGVATAFGAIFALNPPTGLCLAGTWLLIAITTRYSSLSSLVTAIVAPLFAWFFTQEIITTETIMLMSLILIYRHRTNIAKLFAGQESKIGAKR